MASKKKNIKSLRRRHGNKNFGFLCEDLIYYLMTFLPPNDVAYLANVCRSYRKAADLYVKRSTVLPKYRVTSISRLVQIKNYKNSDKVREMVISHGNPDLLKRLRLRPSPFSETLIALKHHNMKMAKFLYQVGDRDACTDHVLQVASLGDIVALKWLIKKYRKYYRIHDHYDGLWDNGSAYTIMKKAIKALSTEVTEFFLDEFQLREDWRFRRMAIEANDLSKYMLFELTDEDTMVNEAYYVINNNSNEILRHIIQSTDDAVRHPNFMRLVVGIFIMKDDLEGYKLACSLGYSTILPFHLEYSAEDNSPNIFKYVLANIHDKRELISVSETIMENYCPYKYRPYLTMIDDRLNV